MDRPENIREKYEMWLSQLSATDTDKSFSRYITTVAEAATKTAVRQSLSVERLRHAVP